jgi:hypothetical protein
MGDFRVEEFCHQDFPEEGNPGFSGRLKPMFQTIRRPILEYCSANFKEIEINCIYNFVT